MDKPKDYRISTALGINDKRLKEIDQAIRTVLFRDSKDGGISKDMIDIALMVKATRMEELVFIGWMYKGAIERLKLAAKLVEVLT